MKVSWRALLPTSNWLRLGIVPVLAFLATVTDRHYLADFWHHLARGRAIVENGQVVNHDLFTFTVANIPLQDVNWLTQVGYFALHDLGGLALVQVVNSLIIAITMLMLVRLCQRRVGAMLPAVIAGGVAFFGLWEVLTIRPQTLSMLLFVLILDLLERSQHKPWLLILPPPLIALWANLHGAFPAGIILVGCFTIAAVYRWKTDSECRTAPSSGHHPMAALFCLAVSILATCLNPYGWTIYRYVGGTSAIAYERQIAEWVRPTPDRLIGIMWIASVAAVVGLLAVRWRKTRQRPALRDVLLLGGFLLLSAGSVRMVAWWMLVSAPVLAELLAWFVPSLAAAEGDAEKASPGVGVMFALMVLAVVFSLPGLDRFNPLLGPTRREPRIEEDIEEVHRHLAATTTAGNIFSHFEWGEYLAWSASPRYKVFMDGRIEIYPDDVWEKYTAVTFAKRDWDQILHDYGVDYLILDTDYHSHTGLLRQVAQSPNWRQAFQARSVVLFVRQPGIACGHEPAATNRQQAIDSGMPRR